MKYIAILLLFISSIYAQVKAPAVLTDNNFETAEYQLFITNTKGVKITSEMTSKVIFEGEADDYYENYSKMNQKRFNAAEEIGDRALMMSQGIGNAVYFNDVKALQNFGVAAVGSIALNAVLGGILGDDTYVQVVDYYKDNQPVTRIIKYIVADDGLDEEEIKLVFSTTNDQSYHFRSGGFSTVTFK